MRTTLRAHRTVAFVLATVLSLHLAACALRMSPLDIADVQQTAVKGQTTIAEVEQRYGKPYERGLLKDGTQYLYYLSANPLTGASQDFSFYFDEAGRLTAYASEYPGGNPLLQK